MADAITVKSFLANAEAHLRVGDIVLSRSPTLTSWLIRKITGSQFSHAALVFMVAKPEEGFNNTFLLESISAGVGLANLQDYIGGKNPHAEIVILRLEGAELDERFLKKVRGLMLDHVKSGYDFRRVLEVGWSNLRDSPRKAVKDALTKTRKRLRNWKPRQFICSGFIQYGLAKAAELQDIKTNVLLKEGISGNDRDAILAVTPEDVARSPRLTWRFAARRGWVHEVKGYDEALKILE